MLRHMLWNWRARRALREARRRVRLRILACDLVTPERYSPGFRGWRV